MAQNLPIHSTDNKHTVNLLFPPLLLAPLHTDPLPTIADPLPAAHIDTHHLVCVLTPHAEAFPDTLLLCICLARRAPFDVPPVATSPEAPSWIPGSEQGPEGTVDSDASADEGTEGDELVKAIIDCVLVDTKGEVEQ